MFGLPRFGLHHMALHLASSSAFVFVCLASSRAFVCLMGRAIVERASCFRGCLGSERNVVGVLRESNNHDSTRSFQNSMLSSTKPRFSTPMKETTATDPAKRPGASILVDQAADALATGLSMRNEAALCSRTPGNFGVHGTAKALRGEAVHPALSAPATDHSKSSSSSSTSS